MNMKRCPKCGDDKELEEFPINVTSKDGHGSSCKACQREYTKEHYNGNKKQYADRNKRREDEARQYITDVKKNSVCKCGESRWWVMDFHHKDGDKEKEVSKLITYGIEAVKREIAKCDVMCSNCHRDLHYQERQDMLL